MLLFRRWLLSARGRVFLTAGAIGLVGLVVGAILALRGMDRFAEIWLEIFAAPLILALVEILIRWLESRLETRERRHFARFFGKGVVTYGVRAVFPTAEPPLDEGEFCQLIYSRPPAAAQKASARAKGIRYVVPIEDLTAVRALAELCQRMGARLRMTLDKYFDGTIDGYQRETLIGVGLGFNHVTAQLAAMAPDLFEIVYEGGTDDFHFAKARHGFPTDKQDCALVARIVHGGGRPPGFVCAGRTAAGTAAAGMYLANHWKDLLRLYRREHHRPGRHSMAVLLRFPSPLPQEAQIHKVVFSPAVVPERLLSEEEYPAQLPDEEAHAMAGA